MISRVRSTALFGLAAAVLAAIAACGGDAPTTRVNPAGNFDATPVLLPTPTIAQAAIAGDPLRPPTPIVYPTPTPAANTGAGDVVSNESAAGSGDEPVKGEDIAIEANAPIETISIPPGLTPAERLELGRTALAEGDFASAAAAFETVVDDPQNLSDAETAEAKLGLAIALLEEDRLSEAIAILADLAQTPSGTILLPADGSSVGPAVVKDVATYHLGRARTRQGDHAGAVEAYSSYLQANPDMAAYIGPLIADGHLALGDTSAAISALANAVEGPAQRFKAVENRLRLAGFYMAQGETAAAITQYDAIRDIAQTEATKGQMTYLAGQAEILAGNTEAGYQRYLFGVENYPRAAETHRGLIELVNAGVPVDDYQRGIVNFYAGSYLPGIEAFRRHIAAEPETYQKDSHLFLARSYEALGDPESAFAELDTLAEHDPATAFLERAEMQTRLGDFPSAIEAYDAFMESHGEDERAPAVLWAVARLADRQGDPAAASRYLALADAYPFDGNTPQALYRAAELSETPDRITLWQRLGEQYPANEYGAEALFRLWQLAQTEDGAELDETGLRDKIDRLVPANYFALRAGDLIDGIDPFVAEGSMSLPTDRSDGLAEAETWLRARLATDTATLPQGSLALLSDPLARDPQRVVGEKLWQLGLFETAKAELETFRQANAADPLANYQMAVYFRDLGLYRSSIIAAAAMLRQVDATIYDAPRFLGRLSFPTYYADLILPLAERYGFDPRLQFALVRQESLFESFARSGAAAQGLSQVIPDTGAWIAQRLAWPGYENDDLYKPYVGLQFGAYYLSEQLRGFDGQVHAALAAYNGGPGNAARWSASAGADLDRFVDTVDFPETRLYIERIYEGFNAYRYLYGRP